MTERVLTKHFPKRWLTRIKGLTSAEARAYNDNDKILSEVSKAMDHATYIATTTIGDNPEARYYVNNDIVIVVSADDKSYVTTWRIQYDLPEGLDKTFRESLMTAIVKERELLAEQQAEVDMLEKADIEQQQQLRRDITQLRKELKSLEDYEATLSATIKSHSNRVLPLRIKHNKHIKQLLNSKDMWKSFNAED